jgi:hypothetical protein
MRQEVTGGWRKFHNEQFCNLHSSPNITMIGSRRMTWAENVSRMGEMKSVYKLVFRKPERARHSGDLGAEERIMVKWITE